MTTPSLPAQLETALDELVMAHLTLESALAAAHLSALHSTYTAAIKRLLASTDRTIKSTGNLLEVLSRQPSQSKL